MGKYNQLKYLKKTKARVRHQCAYCGGTILPGEYYYREVIHDRFLQSLHSRSFCVKCYEQHGETLLKKKSRKAIVSKTISRKLNTYFGNEHKNEEP